MINGGRNSLEHFYNWRFLTNYPRTLSCLPSSLTECTFNTSNLQFSPYNQGIFSPSHSLGWGKNWISIFQFSKVVSLVCIVSGGQEKFSLKNQRSCCYNKQLLALHPYPDPWIHFKYKYNSIWCLWCKRSLLMFIPIHYEHINIGQATPPRADSWTVLKKKPRANCWCGMLGLLFCFPPGAPSVHVASFQVSTRLAQAQGVHFIFRARLFFLQLPYFTCMQPETKALFKINKLPSFQKWQCFSWNVFITSPFFTFTLLNKIKRESNDSNM